MTIDLNPTSDQRQIVDAVQRTLAEAFPPSRLRGAHSVSPDRARLGTLADLGAFGLGTPEAAGGTGLGIADEVLMFEMLGRNLVTPVALAATLAGRAAWTAGQTGLARAIIEGRQPVCLANALRPFALAQPEGMLVHLLDRAEGEEALAVLWNDEGLLLLHLEGGSGADAQLQAVAGTDRSVTLHRGTLASPNVLCRLPIEECPLAIEASLLVSAQLLGMAQACCEMAVEYAKVRHQFGQPIGAFQAVKHRCADMAVNAEVLRAQVAWAALAQQHGWPDARMQTDACRMLASRLALANARANIQVHGGMGFTAECDAHLYVLRAHLYETLGGPPGAVAQRLVKA